MKSLKGFTLIELLVVISIIGLLSTIAGSSVMKATKKARMAKRMADMRVIQKALETYLVDFGQYPDSGGAWRSECPVYGGFTKTDVIPGLVPRYLSTFPSDPKMNIANSSSCYLYRSNGTSYKLLDHQVAEYTSADYLSQPSFVDPNRDGGGNVCIIDGVGPWAWSVSSPDAPCF